MPDVRTVARTLCAEALIDITQKGREVDPLSFKGPIRLRLRPAAEADKL